MTCLVYLDDNTILGRSFDEQLARLREVFNRIRSANLKLKPIKCSLFQRSVSFLGHFVSEHGISMQSQKVRAIRDWPPCENLTELRAFLGNCSYYRRFVKDVSQRREPIISGQLSVNEHLKLSSSGSCPSQFLLCLWTQGPTLSTMMRAVMAWEPYCPRSNPESRR